jgi:hypothetical protein
MQVPSSYRGYGEEIPNRRLRARYGYWQGVSENPTNSGEAEVEVRSEGALFEQRGQAIPEPLKQIAHTIANDNGKKFQSTGSRLLFRQSLRGAQRA